MSEEKYGLDCSVVKDLLPNYVEGLTSEETNEKVARHLQGCPNCNGSYYYMKAQMELPKNNKKEKGVAFLKKQKVRWLVWVIAAILLLWCLLAVGVAVLHHSHPVAAKDIHLTGLYELSTGEVVCAFKIDGLNPSAVYLHESSQTSLWESDAAFRQCQLFLSFEYTNYKKWFSNGTTKGDTFYYVFDPADYYSNDYYTTNNSPFMIYDQPTVKKVTDVMLDEDNSRIWWPEREDIQRVSGKEEALLQEQIAQQKNGGSGGILKIEPRNTATVAPQLPLQTVLPQPADED